MVWQDFALTLINSSFGFAMLPELRDVIKGKKININVHTCLVTFLLLCGTNIIMATLEFWFSTIPFCTSIWGLLLYFSWKNKKEENITPITQ